MAGYDSLHTTKCTTVQAISSSSRDRNINDCSKLLQEKEPEERDLEWLFERVTGPCQLSWWADI
jgi:hypothetical protein